MKFVIIVIIGGYTYGSNFDGTCNFISINF